MKTSVRLVLGLIPLLGVQCGVAGNSLEDPKAPESAGIHLGVASSPPPTGALIWKDANAKTVGLYTLVTTYYNPEVINSFMDDQGIFWQVNPAYATTSALRVLLHVYSTLDCSGTGYWQVKDSSSGNTAPPRWALFKLGTTTNSYVTLRDKAVGQLRAVNSYWDGTVCSRSITGWLVYADSDLRPITPPSDSFTAPLHIEQQM